MPLYEYTCPACGHHDEAFVPVDQRDAHKCPVCHKANHAIVMKRQLGKPMPIGLETRDLNDFNVSPQGDYNFKSSAGNDRPTYHMSAGLAKS